MYLSLSEFKFAIDTLPIVDSKKPKILVHIYMHAGMIDTYVYKTAYILTCTIAIVGVLRFHLQTAHHKINSRIRKL